MKKNVILVALTLLSCFQVIKAQNAASNLVVNEIMAKNIDMMLDPSYNYGGWIELYNPTDAAISLNGLYISNDKDNLKMVAIPSGNGSVPANGFKTLWFDHYSTGNEYSDKAKNQIDFKIDPEGDILYISDRNGNLLITQTCPPAIARTSYARQTDGGEEWGYTYTPTQGKSNAGSTFAEEQLDLPMVDLAGTVYKEDFDIHVNIPEGATLRYTTDGTVPDLDNGSTSEDGVFHIGGQKNYAYRFRLFKDGFLPSDVATHTYIYNSSNYYLPIVSVVTNPDNLYGSKIGVLVDGTNGTTDSGGYRFVHGSDGTSNKNRGWERPVNFELIVPNKDKEYCVALNQGVDLEVSGGWSRHFPPSPSFKLKAGKIYGEKFFSYPIFSQKPYTRNKAIIVRNGGNDCECRIVDAAINEIISSSGFHLDCQTYQPAHVFINGEYKFMFNLRETTNKNYAYANYGIDTDEVDQFEYAGGGNYVQKEGDDQAFVKWTTLCNELSSNPEDDAKWNQICELCDIDEVCNYFATECYVGSADWVTNGNNTKGFRDRNNGKFHFVFFDVDEAFKRTDLLSRAISKGWWGFDNKSLTTLLYNLITRPSFKKRFIDTYCVVAGSVFDVDRSSAIINSMAAYSEAALALDGLNPWTAKDKHNLAGNSISGNDLLDDITNKSKRDDRIKALKDFFSLKKSFDVTIKSNLDKASLMLNDVKIPTGKLEGTVFAPAVLTAAAPAGYAFKGWKIEDGASTTNNQIIKDDATWQYYDQGSLDGTSWQLPSYNAASWKSGVAPLGYNNQNTTSTQLDWGDDSGNKRPTYYFRRRFPLTKAPDNQQTYTFTYTVDDGCIIYVNGTEVHRNNMPDGDVTYSTFSPSTDGQQVTASFNIDPALLNYPGNNVIAVEVHNNNAPSSDIYWSGNLSFTEPVDGDELINADDPELNLESIITGNGHTNITAYYEPIDDEDIIANREDEPYAPIRINEVSAGNTIYVNEQYKKNDWIELYNPTDMTLNVAGLYVSDDPDKPQKYQIPAGNPDIQTFIKPGGKLIIWADKLKSEDYVFTNMPLGMVREGIYFSNLHASFKLNNDEGIDQEVILTWSDEFIANNQEYFEKHPSFKHFADHIIYQAHKGDQTVGRYPDGGNSFYVMNRPTIGQNNSLHSYDRFIGKDNGVIVEDPDAIEPILAKNDQISIRFAGTKLIIQGETTTAQLDIYSIAGLQQQSQTVSLASGAATVAIGDFPAGVYIARVKGADGSENNCKFVIR
jgi:hypothetical protein